MEPQAENLCRLREQFTAFNQLRIEQNSEISTHDLTLQKR